jgi:hypothetical protein
MNDLIKPVSVGLLFVFIAACDYLKIADPQLRDAAFAMVGIITSWHGYSSWKSGKSTSPLKSAGPLQ